MCQENFCNVLLVYVVWWGYATISTMMALSFISSISNVSNYWVIIVGLIFVSRKPQKFIHLENFYAYVRGIIMYLHNACIFNVITSILHPKTIKPFIELLREVSLNT